MVVLKPVQLQALGLQGLASLQQFRLGRGTQTQTLLQVLVDYPTSIIIVVVICGNSCGFHVAKVISAGSILPQVDRHVLQDYAVDLRSRISKSAQLFGVVV
jgi:small-conductance mechanosensitive channel